MTIETVDTDIASLTPTERVRVAFARIDEVDRPEIWIDLRDEADVIADAHLIEDRVASGADLPLAGWIVAVKNNIDVAGLPTTAACPEFAYLPEHSAPAVELLTAAGAVVIGTTNLDQFATGLVGTRSPYGAVRNATHPEHISGGSSSGSAVAVALGIADIALGTDTAGSGRVPAALNEIVGLKPTPGLVSTRGVVPACPDYDVVTVFARTLPEAARALGVIARPDTDDPRSRVCPSNVAAAAPGRPSLAVPLDHQLDALSADYRVAWGQTLDSVRATDITVTPVDISALLDAALLLYDGAIVAERYAAVGEFVAAHADEDGLDPIVTAIITGAAEHSAADFVADLGRLRAASAVARDLLNTYDGLLLPTTTDHPTIDEVSCEPVAINRRMGTFTNFGNLLDLAAVAVPAHRTAAGMPFGVMVIGPAFADQTLLDIAGRLGVATGSRFALAAESVELPAAVTGTVPLAVFGAHRRGAPLHHELEAIGARFVGDVDTTDAYRLYSLPTVPPKPGLVRVEDGAGQPINGELYRVSTAGLGAFLAALPAPMALTTVELSDGRSVTGFSCTHDVIHGAEDITAHRNWLRYLAQR